MGIYSQSELFSSVVEEENAQVAQEDTDSYKAAKEIVQASLRYRDVLLEAQKTLKPSN